MLLESRHSDTHMKSIRGIGMALAGLAGFALVSCVSLVTPEQSAIEVSGVKPSSVRVAVADHRKEVAGGRNEDRYYGRCRLGLYGIPTPIIDPKMSVSDRLAAQMEAGFRKRGVDASKVSTTRLSDPLAAADGSSRTLVVRLDNVWMDFANPLTGNESILYFDATAQVVGPGRKVQATARRSFEKEFRYDPNDSLFNQAVWTLQPEFTQLVNQPQIRSALAR